MADQQSLRQARFVFATGKRIHDWVHRIQSKHLSCLDARERFGDLSMAQVNALMVIRNLSPLSLTELAAQLGVSPPSASAMVDRLVEKGIVSRETSPEDRRRVVIGISPAALEQITAIEEIIFKSFVDLVECIGPDATKQWCAVLKTVDRALDQFGATGAK